MVENTRFEILPFAESKTGLAYFPSTGGHPCGIHDEALKTTRHNLSVETGINYSKAYEGLINDFFSLKTNTSATKRGKDLLKALTDKGHFGPTTRPKGNRKAGTHNEGWLRMPAPHEIKHISEQKFERRVADEFILIWNEVIRYVECGKTRVAIDCQDKTISCFGSGKLKPDVFLWGHGSGAFPPPQPAVYDDIEMSDMDDNGPQVEADSDEAYAVMIDGSTYAVDWPWCLVPVEVKTSRARGQFITTSLDQLASYVREVFAAQPHRRFVPTLLITECRIEFIVWDRTGLLRSTPLDYHEEPAQFCAMLIELVLWDDRQMGFDTSASFILGHNAKGEPLFDTMLRISVEHPDTNEVTQYRTGGFLLSSYNISSRGSVCWKADTSALETKYLIHDSWSTYDSIIAEQTCLRYISQAQTRSSITDGVLSFVSFQNIHLDTGLQDVVFLNREWLYPTPAQDVHHVRTVWKYTGEDLLPLSKCQSPLELVCVLRDIITGLQTMLSEAKVIHREITIWNILMQRQPPFKRTKGFLLDFSCATMWIPDSHKNEARKDWTPGAHVFMSRNALNKKVNSYRDDLESVYYVICWIIGAHRGFPLDERRKKKLPTELINWMPKVDEDCNLDYVKNKFLLVPTFSLDKYSLDKTFSPLEPLIGNLHRFFHLRAVSEATAYPLSNWREEFREVLGYFDDMLDTLVPKRMMGPKITKLTADCADNKPIKVEPLP